MFVRSAANVHADHSDYHLMARFPISNAGVVTGEACGCNWHPSAYRA